MRKISRLINLTLIFSILFNIVPLGWISNQNSINFVNAETALTREDFKKFEGKIAVNDSATFVLKDDGHVVPLSYSPYDDVKNWNDITYISAGIEHVVGLKNDGTVFASGTNNYGETDVSSWTDIVSISAGDHFTVGLKKNGTVVIVGDSSHGQNGVNEWTNIIAVSAGGNHVVGLKEDGTVLAVGDNYFGQLEVSYWQDIVAISAGGSHTVGLKSDGTVVAAGNSNTGQSNVYGMQNIVSISAGAHYTMGLKSDGTVILAGLFSTDRPNYSITNWENVVAISVGEYTMASIKSDGTIQVESAYYYRQQNVESAWSDITSIATGWYQNLGVKINGTVVSSGSNEQGESNVQDWNDIVQVAGGKFFSVGLKRDGTVRTAGSVSELVNEWTNIVSITAGEGHVVGLKNDGTVVGTGAYGTKEDGWSDIIKLSAGGSFTLGLKRNGTVVVAGNNNKGQFGATGWYDIVDIAAGLDFSVGLKSDGTVVASGNNQYGQTNVSSWKDIVAISAGYNQTIGLKRDGTVVSTGNNQYSQGNVEQWKDIVSVSASISRTLGLKKDGTVISTDASKLPSEIIKPQYRINKRIVKPNDDIKINLSTGTIYNVTQPFLSLNGGINLENQEMTQIGNGEFEFNYKVQSTDQGIVNVSFPGTTDIFGNTLMEDNFLKVIPLQSIKASKAVTKSGEKVTLTATFYESVKPGFTLSLNDSQYLSGAQMTEVAGSNGTKYIYTYTVPYNHFEGPVDVSINNVETVNGSYFLKYTEEDVFIKQNRPSPISSLTVSKTKAKIGEVVTITANFSEPIKNGVALSFDGASQMNPAIMNEVSGSTGTQYTFDYIVPEGFEGILNAHITDVYDMNNNLCQEYISNSLFEVDGKRASILSFSASQPLAKNGDLVTFTATFSEPVLPTFKLSLNNGIHAQDVSMHEVEDTGCTVFKYDYEINGGDAGEVQATINGIEDFAGNISTTYNFQSLLTTDGINPSVVSLESDSIDYVPGEYAHIVATFDESIKPGVKINISGGINNEEYVMTEIPGSNGQTYELYYEIKEGQKGSVNAVLSNVVDIAGNDVTYSKANIFYISDASNANLASISITDGSREYILVPEFSKEIDSYTVNVPPYITSVEMNGKVEDSRASLVGNGIKNLVQGDNVFELKVTSSNSTVKVYKITINVGDNTGPEIFGASDKTIGIGSMFNPAEEVTAIDNVDGDLTSVITIDGSVDTNIAGEYLITYSVSDNAGNSTTVTRLIKVVDMTPPEKPNVNEVVENQTVITGQSEPNTTVVAKVNETEIGSTLTDEIGNFAININGPSAGAEIKVFAIDSDGNQSDPAIILVKDITEPIKPIVNNVGDKDLFVTGEAEPGAEVTVSTKGSVIGKGKVLDNGQFSVSILKQRAGTELVISVTDLSGNSSESSVVRVNDVTAPAAPKIYSVTNQSAAISGKSEVGATIMLDIGLNRYTTIADMNGNYKLNISNLAAGTVVNVRAKDAVGNESNSTQVTVTDIALSTVNSINAVTTVTDETSNQAEEIPIIANDVKSLVVLSFNEVTNLSKAVTGQSEANTTVYVSIGKYKYTAIADGEGYFSIPIPQQKPGTIILLSAKDDEGNQSVEVPISVIGTTSGTKK